MRILATCDDGIHSDGFAALIGGIKGLGEIDIVAPADERSAVGTGFTLRKNLRVRRIEIDGIAACAVDGTPVDCVKLYMKNLAARPPDLVVSGVNRGHNAGTDVFYSGTCAAAIEAAICGVPGVAFSLAFSKQPYWATAALVARKVVEGAFHSGLPPRVFLNVNVPDRKFSAICGVKVVRQSGRGFREYYDAVQKSDNEWDFVLAGAPDLGDETESDVTELHAGYVTVTPLRASLFAGDLVESIKSRIKIDF